MLLEAVELQAVLPLLPAQVQQHLLLQVVLPVVDGDGVVVPVQAVDERRDRRLVEVPDVGGRLAGLLAKHQHLVVDEPEAVDDDLTLDGLYRVHHDPHGPGVQLLEALLGVDVGAREPAAEAGVGVVPAHDHLRSPRLLQHVQHLGLEDGVHGLDADAVPGLRHGEDVHYPDSVVIDELAQHQAHHLHGNARSPVLQHLQQSERGDVDLLRGVRERRVLLGLLLASAAHAGEVPENPLQVEVPCHLRGSGPWAGSAPRGITRRGASEGRDLA
mmetsp:Transcript_46170/g.143021  ORF Transcript_46170/g.143021 Transcript_46170/m.143021 type:complete len:272 (+) Transcript_46170:250-1065(+)